MNWTPHLLDLLFFGLVALSVAALMVHEAVYRSSISKGCLPDPRGNIYSAKGRLTRPVLGLFSVPEDAQGERQDKWLKYLTERQQTRVPSSVGFFLIEDMKAAAFKELARRRLKKEHKKGSGPVVVLDEDGTMRGKFGVPWGKTVVLLYDKKNHLCHVEEGPPTESAAKRLHAKICRILEG